MSLSDRRAVVYSRNSLDTGDTLVILHPEDYRPLDCSGFALNRDVRVHSRRLISTGSTKFEKIFSVNVQRAARLCHYPDGLPTGIDFILDLRLVAAMNLEDGPSVEDMPEKLISELKCSTGVRSWFKSQMRCGVSHDLVGGRDVIAATDQDRPSPRTASTSEFKPLVRASTNKTFGSLLESEGSDVTFQADMLEALQISALEHGSGRCYVDSLDGRQEETSVTGEEAPEFCPVRYRVGIEHLLQIIEGKDPTWLDTAPKIWTLYVVAKYFECTRYVVSPPGILRSPRILEAN